MLHFIIAQIQIKCHIKQIKCILNTYNFLILILIRYIDEHKNVSSSRSLTKASDLIFTGRIFLFIDITQILIINR